MTENKLGKFITVEGCEGVGKSTQIRFLKEYCEKYGIDAVFTREPGGTDIAEKIRGVILDADNKGMDPLTELFLYAAARRQHTRELIIPALKAGKTVFCDRYNDSTLSYQGYARGLDKNMISVLNGWASDGAKIDLTVFIDVDPSEGFRRKGGADENDRLEREGMEFHEKVYRGFKDIAEKEKGRVVCVKADGTKFETHAKIVALLKEKKIF